MNKAYEFNSVGINTNDNVFDIMFETGNNTLLDLSKYPLKKLRRYMFYFNSDIEEVVLPEGLEEMDYSFVGCRNLSKINIPQSVKKLDYHFGWHSELWYDQNNWANGVFYLHDWAIDCEQLSTITIKDGTKGISESFSYASSFDDETPSIITLNLPSSLEIIGYDAFRSQDKLKQVILPSNLKILDGGAFAYCTSLEKVTLRANLEETGSSCFYSSGSTSTSSQIYIGKEVSIIPDYLFYQSKFRKIVFESTPKITTIGQYALANTNITSITLPKSIKTIKRNALYGCSSLTNITYSGTMAEWNNVTKESAWASSVGTSYVQCSNGQVQI